MHDIKDHNDMLLSPVLGPLTARGQELGLLTAAVSRLFSAAGPLESAVCSERDFVDLGSHILSAPAGLGSNPSSTCCPGAG